MTAIDPRHSQAGRPLLTIGRVASAFALIAIGSAPSSSAQQPAAAAGPPAEKKAQEGQKKEVATKVDAEAAARAEANAEATKIFRSQIVSELRFIRAATGASDEQTRRMARKARELPQSKVADFVAAKLKARRVNRARADFDWQGTQRSLREKLAAIAREQLTPEQWARFEAQAARRLEQRRRVFLGSLLAGLDDELVLTAGQLEQIRESLASHWDPRWELEDVINRPRPFPALPDPLIVPYLTEAQTSVWRKLEKHPFNGGGYQWNMLLAELAEITREGMPNTDDLEAELAKAPPAKP
jgi:hypothetical protein